MFITLASVKDGQPHVFPAKVQNSDYTLTCHSGSQMISAEDRQP
ncbi:hypothetical protein [Larkinella terrae]|nr:hypothetical protein [Larkinella terrae]